MFRSGRDVNGYRLNDPSLKVESSYFASGTNQVVMHSQTKVAALYAISTASPNDVVYFTRGAEVAGPTFVSGVASNWGVVLAGRVVWLAVQPGATYTFHSTDRYMVHQYR